MECAANSVASVPVVAIATPESLEDATISDMIQTADQTIVEDVIVHDKQIVEPDILDHALIHRQHMTRKRTFRQKSTRFARKVSLYLLSYVGLTGIVVGYSILGGFIFVELERPHEELTRTKVTKLRRDRSHELYQLFNTPYFDNRSGSSFENWTNQAAVDGILRKFQIDIYKLVQEEGWTGDDDISGSDPKWTFAGGLLFSVTVITTIGYGFITPKTIPGQAVTMLYAIVGIPLTFLFLTNIGSFMASCFRTMYGRTFCVSCRSKFLGTIKLNGTNSHETIDKIQLQNFRNHSGLSSSEDRLTAEFTPTKKCNQKHDTTEVPVYMCLVLVVWYIVFGAFMFSIWETQWSLFTGAYFCFITLSTIGFGDIVPGLTHKEWNDQVKMIACTLYLIIGLSFLAMCFDLMQQRGRGIARRFARFIGLVHSK